MLRILYLAIIIAFLATASTAAKTENTLDPAAIRGQIHQLEDAGASASDVLAKTRDYIAACERRYPVKSWQAAECRITLANALVNNAEEKPALDILESVIRTFESSKTGKVEIVARAQFGVASLLPIGSGDVRATTLFENALAILAKAGPEYASYRIDALTLYAARQISRGDLQEAKSTLVRAESEAKGLELPVPTRLRLLTQFGRVEHSLGNYAEAEKRLLFADSEMDKYYPKLDPRRHTVLAALMATLRSQVRTDESEAVARRILEIFEKAYGPDDIRVADALNDLSDQLPYSEAEQAIALLKRVSVIYGNTYTESAPEIGQVYGSLSARSFDAEQLEEAEKYLRRSMAIDEANNRAIPTEESDNLSDLARQLASKGQTGEAIEALKKAISLRHEIEGENSNIAWNFRRSLGETYAKTKNYGQAVETFRSLAAVIERNLGAQSLPAIEIRAFLGNALVQSGKADEGLALSRQAIESIQSMPLTKRRGLGLRRTQALRAAIVAIALQTEMSVSDKELLYSALQLVTQDVSSLASQDTLTRFATDVAGASALLEALQRADNDIATFEHRTTSARAASDRSLIQIYDADLAKARNRAVALRADLQTQHPELAQMRDQPAASIASVQAVLRHDEAMLMALQTGNELVLALATDSHITMNLTKLTGRDAKALADAVLAGVRLNGIGLTTDLPKFDLQSAHKIYQAALGPFAKQMAGKKTLFVSLDGPLASVPPAAWVTNLPSGASGQALDNYRSAGFLIDKLNLAVIPSAATFVSLRSKAHASKADKGLLAVAAPALVGQRKLESGEQFANLRGSMAASAAQKRTGRAVCQLQPLPETAVEANMLAAKFGADRSQVMTGDSANEANLKAMSANGELRRYRSLLFATHGLVSGELQSGQEPALVLTPLNGCAADVEPEDGLLTSSDIMNLSLDADWVVLSACNTAAASSGANVRPLSGLARAFFFAGARGVIASYWGVDSQSVVDLIGGTFSDGHDLQQHLSLATAMRKMRQSQGEQGYRAHPAFWAPFVVVGDIRR